MQVYLSPKRLSANYNKAQPKSLFTIKLSGKEGCMDIEGKIVIEPKFDNVQCSDDELIPFEVNEKWGFVNQTGEIILEPQFYLTTSPGSNYFSEGLAVVCMNAKCGYIDSSGKYVIEPKFDYAMNFSEGMARVQIGAYNLLGYNLKTPKSVFINKEGKILFNDSNFIPQSDFSEGLAQALIEDEVIYIDKSGQTIINSTEIDVMHDFHEGLAIFSYKDIFKLGYVDKNGQIVIAAQFKQAGEFSEGLANVMFESGKYGYIDKTGKTIIEPQFDMAGRFSEGLALVMLSNRKGFIDKTGKIIIPINLGGADPFFQGLAMFTFEYGNTPYTQTKWGYIDKTGKIIWKPSN